MNSFSGTYTQLFSLSLPFESKPKLNTKTLLQEKTSSGYTNLQMSNNWGNGNVETKRSYFISLRLVIATFRSTKLHSKTIYPDLYFSIMNKHIQLLLPGDK